MVTYLRWITQKLGGSTVKSFVGFCCGYPELCSLLCPHFNHQTKKEALTKVSLLMRGKLCAQPQDSLISWMNWYKILVLTSFLLVEKLKNVTFVAENWYIHVHHTRVCNGIQGYERVYRGMQGYTGVWKDIQGYTRVYRGIPGYTGVYKGILGYTGV